jgi:hypothetical protein
MKTLLISTFLFPLVAYSAPLSFTPEDGGVKFSIKYTAGVHHGTASGLTGTVSVDPDAQLVTARLVAPISQFSTGNDTRDCHMRESLGIDYGGSRFPAQSVCDNHNQTPATGPDSIAFPDVVFELLSFRSGEPVSLEPGKSYDLAFDGRFTFHGTSSQVTAVPLHVQVQPDGKLLLTGALTLSLVDHGVVVRPFLVIKTADTAQVQLNLTLAPEAL